MLFFFFCLLSSFVLNHHVWFIFALYLVFFFLLFLVFVAFIFCNFLDFGYLSKNISEKLDIAKNPKMKNAQKKDILTRAVSTGVLTNSVFFSFLCFFKFCIFCWKHYKNRGFSQKKKKKNTKKNKKPSVKNWSKLALKTGPSMLRNKIGPVFNARNVVFFLFVFLLFFEKSSSFCRENEIFKNKKTKKTKKIGPVFNTRKGKNWTSF